MSSEYKVLPSQDIAKDGKVLNQHEVVEELLAFQEKEKLYKAQAEGRQQTIDSLLIPRAKLREEFYAEIVEAQGNAYENRDYEAGESLEVLIDWLQTNETERLRALEKKDEHK